MLTTPASCWDGSDAPERKNSFPLPNGWEYDGPFIRQVAPRPFVYTEEYKSRLGTNELMSGLRLGWLASHFGHDRMRSMKVVDFGCGNGTFVRFSKGKFASISGYDICGDSMSKDELMSKRWDLVVASDVLEHMLDIKEFFSIKWEWAMLSFPETPSVGSFAELSGWRHFKPDEHVWMLDWQGVGLWAANMETDARLMAVSDFEDLIRTRWNPAVRNISTVLIRRPSMVAPEC